MRTVSITEQWEYDYCVQQGHHPLINPVFVIEHNLRVDIQRELFGKGNKQAHNQKFYLWVWKHKGPGHRCEECGADLPQYSAVHVSHILSRQGYPEIAYDPRNTNILCGLHHNQWENNPKDMRIYAKNQQTISMLKHAYMHKPTTVNV